MPCDAAARGVSAGDRVDVWNDRARLTLEVRISERLRPGVVAVPFGWWEADHNQRATANSLTSDTLTDWGGGVAYSDTWSRSLAPITGAAPQSTSLSSSS